MKRFNLRFRSRCRIALGVTVLAPGGALRVFDLHLDTRINPADRLEQIAPVLEAAVRFPAGAVIGGDFNTAEIRWLGHVLPLPYLARHGTALRAELERSRFRTPLVDAGATFDFPAFQLDWIFLRGFDTSGHGIVPLDFSDHSAVWVRIAPAAPAS